MTRKWLLAVLLGAASMGLAQAEGPVCPSCGPQHVCVMQPVTQKKLVPQYYFKEVPVCIPNPRCMLFGHKPNCDGECGRIIYKRVVYKRLVPQEKCVMKCVPKAVPCGEAPCAPGDCLTGGTAVLVPPPASPYPAPTAMPPAPPVGSSPVALPSGR